MHVLILDLRARWLLDIRVLANGAPSVAAVVLPLLLLSLRARSALVVVVVVGRWLLLLRLCLVGVLPVVVGCVWLVVVFAPFRSAPALAIALILTARFGRGVVVRPPTVL